MDREEVHEVLALVHANVEAQTVATFERAVVGLAQLDVTYYERSARLREACAEALRANIGRISRLETLKAMHLLGQTVLDGLMAPDSENSSVDGDVWDSLVDVMDLLEAAINGGSTSPTA